jgi:hypothetical protein
VEIERPDPSEPPVAPGPPTANPPGPRRDFAPGVPPAPERALAEPGAGPGAAPDPDRDRVALEALEAELAVLEAELARVDLGRSGAADPADPAT